MYIPRKELFNDLGGIRRFFPRGGHKTSPFREYDYGTLHGRQVCPEINSFRLRAGIMCPLQGILTRRPLPNRGQIYHTHTPFVERLEIGHPQICQSFSLVESSWFRGKGKKTKKTPDEPIRSQGHFLARDNNIAYPDMKKRRVNSPS